MPAFMTPVRVNSATTADALADTILTAGTTTRKPLVVQAKASQTANLTQWQNSTGFPLHTVDSAGGLQWGSGAGAVDTYLYRNSAGQLRTPGSLMVDTTLFAFDNITSNFVAGTEVQVGGVDHGLGPMAGIRMGGDTFLYRSAAGVIRTPGDLLVAGGDLTIDEAGAGAQTPSLILSSNSIAGPTLTAANSFSTLVLSHAYGAATDMSFQLAGSEKAKLTAAGSFSARELTEKKVTFTPTTVGWYRIVDTTVTAGETGGVIRLSGFHDNASLDVELQYYIGGYGQQGSIQETRFASYGAGVVSQARISSGGGGSNAAYLDIYVSKATIPEPISVYAFGPKQVALVAAPVVGAVAGSTDVDVLTLGHGFRTTDDIVGARGFLGTTGVTARLNLVSGTTAADGIAFGTDTNLYRSGNDTLKTDDTFVVGGGSLDVTAGYINHPNGSAGNNWLVGSKFTADTNYRFIIRSDGQLDWGPGGVAAVDTNLYRSAADILKTDDSFVAGGGFLSVGTNPAASGTLRLPHASSIYFRNAANSSDVFGLTFSDTNTYLNAVLNLNLTVGGANIAYLDAANFHVVQNLEIAQGKTISFPGTGATIGSGTTQKLAFYGATPIVQPSSTTDLRQALINLGLYATGGATPLNLNGGQLTSGSVNTTSILGLQTLYFTNAGATNWTLFSGVAGETNHRFMMAADGYMRWGDGLVAATWDTNLYRSAADTLKTDDSLVVGGGLTVTGATPQVFLNGAGSNWLLVGGSNYGPPTLTTRSIGTKMVLFSQIDASNVDYAFGIDNNTLWTSAPTTTSSFKWYGGTTLAATLTGTGTLTTVGPVVAGAYTHATGAYSESTATPGAYAGIVGTPRIMLANGTGAQNWQIDNAAGTMRFFCNAVVAATLTGPGVFQAVGAISTAGLVGATAASRLVGATTTGKPTTGTFVKGDVVIDQTGKIWVNTTAGSPGTWTDVSSAGSFYSSAKWGVD